MHACMFVYVHETITCSISIRLSSAPFGACSTCKPSLGPEAMPTGFLNIGKTAPLGFRGFRVSTLTLAPGRQGSTQGFMV